MQHPKKKATPKKKLQGIVGTGKAGLYQFQSSSPHPIPFPQLHYRISNSNSNSAQTGRPGQIPSPARASVKPTIVKIVLREEVVGGLGVLG